MPLDRRRLIFGFAAAAQAAAVPGLAQPLSNTPSSKAIIIVVPFPVGGSADLSARLLAEHLKTVFGQPVVVENKPGALMRIASMFARRGYNIDEINRVMKQVLKGS